MLRIVYLICCGLDVHKSVVFACVTSTYDKGVTTYASHRFSTFTKGLRELGEWLKTIRVVTFVWKVRVSIGYRYIMFWNIHARSFSLIRSMSKLYGVKKTDKKDAKCIVDIFKHDFAAGSYIPPLDICQLRDLCRYRTKLVSFNTGERNRVQIYLTVSIIQLANVFSDMFGKSAADIINHLLENPMDTDFDFRPLLRNSLKK